MIKEQTVKLYIKYINTIGKDISIWEKARKNLANNRGYQSNKMLTLWQSSNISWNGIYVIYGVYETPKYGIYNISNNSVRGIQVVIKNFHISLNYQRANNCNYLSKFPFPVKLWKFYRLFF